MLQAWRLVLSGKVARAPRACELTSTVLRLRVQHLIALMAMVAPTTAKQLEMLSERPVLTTPAVVSEVSRVRHRSLVQALNYISSMLNYDSGLTHCPHARFEVVNTLSCE